jgi:GMP synthase PP-ATPase subunit
MREPFPAEGTTVRLLAAVDPQVFLEMMIEFKRLPAFHTAETSWRLFLLPRNQKRVGVIGRCRRIFSRL